MHVIKPYIRELEFIGGITNFISNFTFVKINTPDNENKFMDLDFILDRLFQVNSIINKIEHYLSIALNVVKCLDYIANTLKTFIRFFGVNVRFLDKIIRYMKHVQNYINKFLHVITVFKKLVNFFFISIFFLSFLKYF